MSRLQSALVVLMSAVAIGACADSAEIEPRPFESIQEGEIRLSFDSSATVATLEVDTTVPVVCAVVYGPDESFGLIATDDDMMGGAHSDHAPLLTGLEPETEYSYRLQGSDAEGNFYVSEIMPFTTPAASEPEAEAPGSNIALEATVAEVSSEFSGSFSASNAIDGDPSTEWSSAGDGDEAFIVLDLGRTADIVAVAFKTRSMGDGSAVTETYTVTIDGGETLGPFGTGSEPVEVDASGREVRFDVESSTGGNTGAIEVEVYSSS